MAGKSRTLNFAGILVLACMTVAFVTAPIASATQLYRSDVRVDARAIQIARALEQRTPGAVVIPVAIPSTGGRQALRVAAQSALPGVAGITSRRVSARLATPRLLHAVRGAARSVSPDLRLTEYATVRFESGAVASGSVAGGQTDTSCVAPFLWGIQELAGDIQYYFIYYFPAGVYYAVDYTTTMAFCLIP